MQLTRTFAVVIIFAFMVVGHAGASCADASLGGNFGFGLSGLNSSGFFTVSGGLLTLNGGGSLTGTQTTSNNGVITSSVAVTGSYAVKTNCSGTLTITPSGGSSQNYAIVIDSRNTRFEMIETDTGYTVSGYALAQGTVTCTLAAVKGIYGYSGSGWETSPSLFPTATSGETSVDGLGNFKGQQTGSAGGVIVTGTITGTYTVNPDCTGTITSTNSHGNTSHENLVLINNGRTVFEVGTDAGSINFTVAQRQ